MQNIARQLEHVRRRARLLLIAQRLGLAFAVAFVVLLCLGLIDFGLRLPGWLRGIVGGVLLVMGVTWLVRKLAAAWRFGPSVGALALRVERLYPRLAGLLASSLEFGLSPEKYAQPAATAALAQATVRHAERELAGVSVGRLIDLRPTRKLAMFVLLSAALLALVAAAMPTHSAIAAARWLMPWGDTAWPKRTQITAADFPGAGAGAAAIDSPVEFTATVGRGFRPGMRVWINTRWVGDDAGNATSVESFLMTEQVGVDSRGRTGTEPPEAPEPRATLNDVEDIPGAGAGGVFKLQWRAPTDVARRVMSGRVPSATLEVWFEAGDDRTEAQTLTLVARPTLTSAIASIDPPDYAAGLVAPQSAALHEQSQRVASLPTLAGSRVRWTLGLNKALPEKALTAEALVPGLAGVADLEISHPDPRTVVLGFTLERTVETNVALTDEHGLTSAAERVFRFEASEDRPPSVTLLEPSADASVLRTAVVPVAAQANDDVGVRRLSISAQHPGHSEESAEPSPQVVALAEREARSAQLDVDAALDLAALDLRVGDVVVVGARVRDVFDLNGKQHDAVEATPRRLRIIDEATLVSQVRGDLAGVRQQAERLERQQSELRKRLADDAPAALRAEQARLGRAVETQRLQLRRVRERLDMNRLVEPTLDELVRQADELAARAQEASDAAQSALEQAAQDPAAEAEAQAKAQAAAQQEQSRENLEELAELLDQGRDALGLKLELARLRAEQEALAQDTRELLPRTAGRPAESLPEDLQQALRELAERQEALAEQAGDAVERLQDTAESLAQQGESDRDRAAAEALAEAAAVAQRQGLSQQMRQSQAGLQENQLSQAGSSQMESLDTLDRMMQQLGDQDQLRQELLRRRLLALAEKLRRIIEGQTLANAESDKVAADGLPALTDGQSRLWVRTIEAQTDAEAEQDTAEVAPILEQAVEAQAAAIAALRSAAKEEAQTGQRVALERLEEALEKIQEKADEASRDQTRQERAELREQYLELAARQSALEQRTRGLLDEVPLTRKTRAELRGVGQEQAAVREEAAALGEQVAETVVFRQTHGLIDRAAEAAAASLSRGEGDGRLSGRQRKVATLLESMAAALDESGRPREFAESGGGGGGGGGGAGQTPPLVPPAAELKLLRGVQQAVYDETRALAEAGEAGSAAERAARLDDLAAEQRELSAVGRRLIEQMQPADGPELNPAGEP